MVPADIRLIDSSNLKVQESSLTGESVPVEKDADEEVKVGSSLGDRINMAYSSSLVTYGRAEGVVVATGMNTEVGSIAEALNDEDEFDTPIKRKLSAVGKTLSIARTNCMYSYFWYWTFVQKTCYSSTYDCNKSCNFNNTRRASGYCNNSYGSWCKTYGEGKCIS